MSRLMAALYDRVLGPSERACLAGWRAELLADLRGDVLEVGAGTGLNLAHYPDGVEPVLLEPDPHLRRLLLARAGHLRVVDGEAERLPFRDGAFDAVVSTLVLCSVREPHQALSEIHRVLRPGGRLVYLEHVQSERPAMRACQRALEPLWRRAAGNCHLTRRPLDAMRAAGFRLEAPKQEAICRTPGFLSPSVRGVACKLA